MTLSKTTAVSYRSDPPNENANLRQANDSIATMEITEHPQPFSTEPISTDLLFSLPPELLLPIFSFVGVDNFRQDVRRLAVCKEWYAYARPILLGDLRPCTTDLQPMLRAMSKDATLAAAQQMTKHINLTIIDDYSNHIDDFSELEQLASMLKVFGALRSVIIRSRGYDQDMNSQLFSSFATLHQLTSLEMDLENVYFEQGGPHLCDSISRLMPTLKSLRIRLPDICDTLLETPPGDLKEFILIIARTRTFRNHNSRVYWRRDTRRCSRSLSLNYDRHRAALETQLVQFAASMRDPKTVRLFYRLQNPYNACAFDAIRMRRFFLGHNPAWDTYGVLLPEDWKEGEESEENKNQGEYEWSEDNEGGVEEFSDGGEWTTPYDEVEWTTGDEGEWTTDGGQA